MVSGEALKKLQEQIAAWPWAPGCGRTVKLRVVEAALLLQGEDGEGYEKLSDFGKTFFATKEGAEEAKRNEWFT